MYYHENVELFIDLLKKEAPSNISFSIDNNEVHLVKENINNQVTKTKRKFCELLVSYKGTLNNQSLGLQVVHNSYSEEIAKEEKRIFDRLELNSLASNNQVTCIHLGEIGLSKGERIIDFKQLIHFAGKNKPYNMLAKQNTERLLARLGLLLEEKNKASKYYLGTYNTEKKCWLYNYSSEEFIRDFIKVALIIGHYRESVSDIHLEF